MTGACDFFTQLRGEEAFDFVNRYCLVVLDRECDLIERRLVSSYDTASWRSKLILLGFKV